MIIDNESRVFKNISPGLYDNTMQCRCGFKYEDRADNSSEENRLNSLHECSKPDEGVS